MSYFIPSRSKIQEKYITAEGLAKNTNRQLVVIGCRKWPECYGCGDIFIKPDGYMPFGMVKHMGIIDRLKNISSDSVVIFSAHTFNDSDILREMFRISGGDIIYP